MTESNSLPVVKNSICSTAATTVVVAVALAIISPSAEAAEAPGTTPASEDNRRFALQSAMTIGMDVAPNFQWGLLVDLYARFSPRFSVGLRSGTVSTVESEGIVSQVPLDLLLSWDITLPSGRLIIPLTTGAGVSFLPGESNEFFIDMFTLETGVKIKLTESLWLAVLAGGRALMFVNAEHSGFMPHMDFRLMAGPYIRF